MKAVELEDVSVYYDGVCALEDINLKIDDKEFLGIIGPNGAGKSTLLKVILGLIKPFTGEIKIYGKSLENSERVSYVPQVSNFNLKFPVNVMEVVLMGRLNQGFDFFHRYTEKDKEVAREFLKKVDLLNLEKRQIGQLSGGQLQRVLIARALALKPEVLLLDEPTASIDANSRNQMYSLLKKLNEKMTIIVVTHDMSAVSTYFDSIACLNKKLYYHGDKEIKENDLKKVYGCPIDLIAHGLPHRVLKPHDKK